MSAAEDADLPRTRVIVTTTLGKFVMELHVRECPRFSRNFVERVGRRLYDGSTFDRMVPGRLIQGGVARSERNVPARREDGIGSEHHPDVKHEAGAVTMATGEKGTSPSIFNVFLAHDPDCEQTVFARVVRGLKVVRRISETRTDIVNNAVHPVAIHSMRLERRRS